jgi:hypothetical protein
MRKQSKVKTTPMKITLTDNELLCLNNLRKAGSFRSDSHTIGEVLRFVQALRDNAQCLEPLGQRFGITVKEEN